MRRNLAATCLLALLAGLPARHVLAQQPLDGLMDREIASLVATYKALHAAPELSHHEEKTSALLARELKTLGYTVTERVGKYARPEWTGYGVIGVLRNGEGPTVLVRADMDALPIEEKTGLPYASRVKTKDEAGQEVGVMHACGHDVHVTSLLGTAKLLVALKDQWRGTLVLVGQPAEETLDGAQAMLDDGLYNRIAKPDYAIALHGHSGLEAGKVAYTPGFALSSCAAVDITVRGIGGHGAYPQSTKDPVVLAAQIVMALQTLVSRENSPLDPAVVTIGTIHGGTRRNIIPEEVVLQLTVRAYKEEVMRKILAGIERIAKGTAIAAGIPAQRAPIVKVNESGTSPATYNNPALAQRLSGAFVAAFGPANVLQRPPEMGSEDFGRFGLEGNQIPTLMFWIGAADPANVEESQRTGKPLPSLHSPLFAPLPEATIRTGVKAMTAAVLELTKRPR